MGLLGLIIA